MYDTKSKKSRSIIHMLLCSIVFVGDVSELFPMIVGHLGGLSTSAFPEISELAWES